MPFFGPSFNAQFNEKFRKLKEDNQRLKAARMATLEFEAGIITQDEFMDRVMGSGVDIAKLREWWDVLHTEDNPNHKPSGGTPKWRNLAEMNAALTKQRTALPKRDPAARKRAIERELDIIRGRVPTPKGYVIDAGKAKRLMAELKQLS